MSKHGGTKEMNGLNLTREELENGIHILEVLRRLKFVPSMSMLKRLVCQEAIFINSERIKSANLLITTQHVINDEILVRIGFNEGKIKVN